MEVYLWLCASRLVGPSYTNLGAAAIDAILLPNMLARSNTGQHHRYKGAEWCRTGCSKNVAGNIEQDRVHGTLKAEIAGSNPARATNHKPYKGPGSARGPFVLVVCKHRVAR